MQDFAFVKVQKGKSHLRQPVNNLNLCKVLAFTSICLNLGVDVATITVHHDNVQKLLSVDIRVLVSDNVGVSNFL